MQHKNLFKSRQCWRRGLYIATLSLIILGTAIVPNLQAQEQVVNVRVSILGLCHPDCDDGINGPPEIFFKVTVDGITRSNKGENDIYSNLWSCPMYLSNPREFTQPGIALPKGTIPIVIEAWDNDEGEIAGGNDDVCPIGPFKDFLNLALNLSTCKIGGDVTGDCGVEMEGPPQTHLRFKIEVLDPTHAPGLNVRCLHDPIWPQPGQTVTITAEALDEEARLITAGKVDNIVVWINDNTTPYASTAVNGPAGANTLSVTYTPPSGTAQFSYGCRVFDDGQGVYTGGRVVQIGMPAKGRAVPIVYTGPPASRIDIAFIPDEDDFSGPDDPIFLSTVHDLIRDGYYAQQIAARNAGRLFLSNQDTMNFWIALDTGDTDGNSDLHAPANWYKDYNFIDAAALLHANFGQRDFARRNIRIFTTTVGQTGWQVVAPHTLLHESGHTPFGLSDEYCKKGLESQSFFVADLYPNVYDDQVECLGDPLASGVADACQQIKNDAEGCIVNYFRVDPESTYFEDLMTSNGHLTPNRADARRINWLFDLCRSASCD
jgi:hypothetical protein